MSKCAASAASIVGVEAVIGNPWDVLLRKQEPREACASPGTLGSCLRRNTDPSRAAPPSSSGPAPLPRERINLRRNKGQLSPPQGDIIGVSLAFAERRFYQAPSSDRKSTRLNSSQ